MNNKRTPTDPNMKIRRLNLTQPHLTTITQKTFLHRHTPSDTPPHTLLPSRGMQPPSSHLRSITHPED